MKYIIKGNGHTEVTENKDNEKEQKICRYCKNVIERNETDVFSIRGKDVFFSHIDCHLKNK